MVPGLFPTLNLMTSTPRRPALLGLFCAVAAAILFSSKAVIVKLAYQYQVQPAVLLTLRMAMALPFYLAIAFLSGRGSSSPIASPKDMLGIALLGICSYYGSALLDLKGLQYVPANLERLLIYLYPTFVLFIGAMFFGRRVGAREMWCAALAYIGIGIVFLQDLALSGERTLEIAGHMMPEVLWGSLLVLGSALLFACYMVGSETMILRYGGPRFTSLAMMAASVAVASHFAFTHPVSALVQPWQVYALAFVIAVFTTVVPSLLAAEGVRLIGAARTSVAGTSGPIATLVLSYLLLDEAMTAQHLTGMLLVLLSLFFMTRRP